MRASALLCGLALVSPALAQTPGRIQVEVTEELRAKPDACRLDLKVEVRNADPADAAREAADEFKKVKEAFAALKVEGATLTALPAVFTRQEIQGRRGLPAEVEYLVTRPFKVTLEGGDFGKLSETATKVQNELYAAGAKNSSNGGEIRQNYSLKGGWEGASKGALEVAAKRARAKAEGLAAAAGEKLGAAVSVDQSAETNTLDEGEVVFRLRVRVVFATK
jgi:uncharacterized protein YggE